MLTWTSSAVLQTLLFASAVTFAVWSTVTRWIRKTPPGPLSLPFIGVPNMPKEREAVVFRKWAKSYGPLLFMPSLGSALMVIDDFNTAHELLETKASIFCDRPYSFFMKVIGMDWMLTQLSGERFKSRRAVVQRSLTPFVAAQQEPIQERESLALLLGLLKSPEKFLEHVRKFAANLVLATTYGYRIDSLDDSLISNILISQQVSFRISPMLRLAISSFPILQYYPRWLPGSGFRDLCEANRELNQDIRNDPFEKSRVATTEKGSPETFVSSLIREMNEDSLGDIERTKRIELIKDCAGVMYFAAADATSETLTSFILAMALNPHVVKKAQEEIDRKVGGDRLPDFSDRNQVPYIDAIIWEVFRWHSVTPLGFPRCSNEDTQYKGYHIPKGTITFASNWSMFRNEEMFPRPEDFIPERFLGDESIVSQRKKVVYAVWGWGRRICPGRHSADKSLYIVISQVLAAFDIVGVAGLSPQFTTNRIRRVKPFKCQIKPRSEKIARVIEEISDSLHI